MKVRVFSSQCFAKVLKLWHYWEVNSTSSQCIPLCPCSWGHSLCEAMIGLRGMRSSVGNGQRIPWVSHICHQGSCKPNMLLIDWHSNREIAIKEVLSRWWRPCQIADISSQQNHPQPNNKRKYVRKQNSCNLWCGKFLKSRLCTRGKNLTLLWLMWSDMWT